MTRYRVAVFRYRFGPWREARADALRDAVEMGEGSDDGKRIYLNPGVTIEAWGWQRIDPTLQTPA